MDGTTVAVEDEWRVLDPQTIEIHRTARVIEAGTSPGFRVAFEVELDAGDDWQLFVPGALYNRNDTDDDGVEDYLGTYVQDHRDDRLAEPRGARLPAG